MSKRKKESKINFEELESLTHNPFAALGNTLGINPGNSVPDEPEGPTREPAAQKNSLLIRAKRTINQKWVTQIYQFEGDGRSFLQKLKKKLGTGGSIQADHVEIQGDKRKELASLLVTWGYKVRLG